MKITDALTPTAIAGDLLAGGPTAEAIKAANESANGSTNGTRSGDEARVAATPDKLRLMQCLFETGPPASTSGVDMSRCRSTWAQLVR